MPMKKHAAIIYTILGMAVVVGLLAAASMSFQSKETVVEPMAAQVSDNTNLIPIAHGVITGTTATPPTADELLAETNKARTDNGLQPLVLDERLNGTAQAKCQDMLERNYWQHETSDGVKPWQALKDHGILYQTAGENLGYGYKKASDQVTGWMNSPGHRKNLLDAGFTHVGFGICKIDREYQNRNVNSNDYIIVQHFILPT